MAEREIPSFASDRELLEWLSLGLAGAVHTIPPGISLWLLLTIQRHLRAHNG